MCAACHMCMAWCLHVCSADVALLFPSGIFQKNNSRLQEEIGKQQHNLLGAEGSKYNVELVSNSRDDPQQYGWCLHMHFYMKWLHLASSYKQISYIFSKEDVLFNFG